MMYCFIIILEINSINENENNENIDLEYVYMDVLQNENVIEIQPTTNSKDDLKSNFLLIVIKYNSILTQACYVVFKLWSYFKYSLFYIIVLFCNFIFNRWT